MAEIFSTVWQLKDKHDVLLKYLQQNETNLSSSSSSSPPPVHGVPSASASGDGSTSSLSSSLSGTSDPGVPSASASGNGSAAPSVPPLHSFTLPTAQVLSGLASESTHFAGTNLHTFRKTKGRVPFLYIAKIKNLAGESYQCICNAQSGKYKVGYLTSQEGTLPAYHRSRIKLCCPDTEFYWSRIEGIHEEFSQEFGKEWERKVFLRITPYHLMGEVYSLKLPLNELQRIIREEAESLLREKGYAFHRIEDGEILDEPERGNEKECGEDEEEEEDEEEDEEGEEDEEEEVEGRVKPKGVPFKKKKRNREVADQSEDNSTKKMKKDPPPKNVSGIDQSDQWRSESWQNVLGAISKGPKDLLLVGGISRREIRTLKKLKGGSFTIAEYR